MSRWGLICNIQLVRLASRVTQTAGQALEGHRPWHSSNDRHAGRCLVVVQSLLSVLAAVLGLMQLSGAKSVRPLR